MFFNKKEASLGRRYIHNVPTGKGKTRKRYSDAGVLRALGAHCKRLRIQKGYSIDRMSRESDQLSTSVIHRLETGSGAVTVSALTRYAEVLGVPLTRLMDFEAPARQAPSPFRPTVLDGDDPRVKREAFRTLLPLYSLKAAAGYFGRGESVDPDGWVEALGFPKIDDKMFVVRAAGRSMEPRILDGDLVVLRAEPQGTRQGKIVLAQYRGPADPETGGSYAIKKYSSVKRVSPDGQWSHRQITLSPLNRTFEPIILSVEDEADFRILAEFVGVLGRRPG